MDNIAKKSDKGKPDHSLIPKIFMDQLAYAMMSGEIVYGRFNYCEGHKLTSLTAAASRHLKAIEDGEDIDKDCTDRVGLDVYHAACVAANMLMIIHQQELGTSIDDRFVRES